MKVDELLYEAKGTFVLRGGRGDFRVDPNPTHNMREHPNSWTKDITGARVFTERDRVLDSFEQQLVGQHL